MQNLESAKTYHEAGLQVLPLQGKKPLKSWKEYQTKPNTPEQIQADFAQPCNIGIICGEISNNLAVIDFDSMQVFNSVRTRIEWLLNRTPVVKTGRGVHVYVKPVEGAFQKHIGAPGVDVISNGGYVVAPQSIHPDGRQYTFFDSFGEVLSVDYTHLAQLIGLKDPFTRGPQTAQEAPHSTQKEKVTIYTPDVKPYGLSLKLWQALKHPAAPGARSENEYKLVLNCTADGWTLSEIENLFFMHAVKGTKFREKTPDSARKYIATMHAGALQYLHEHRREIDNKINWLYANIDQLQFNPRSRHTDRAVFLALLDIAQRAGKLENIDAATRELAQLAGMTRKTISLSLKRIPAVKQTGRGKTAIFSIDAGPGGSTLRHTITGGGSTLPHTITQGGIRAQRETQQADIFRHRAIGKTGLKIWRALETPQTRKGLQRITGLAKGTVRKKVDLMLSVNMLYKNFDFFHRVEDINFEEIAKALNVDGTGERQRLQHERERAIYQSYLDNKNTI